MDTTDMDRTDISRRVMHRFAGLNVFTSLVGFLTSLALLIYHLVKHSRQMRDAKYADDSCNSYSYGYDARRSLWHDVISWPLLMTLFGLLFVTNRALHSALRHNEVKVHKLGTYNSFLSFLRGKLSKWFLFGRGHHGDAKLEAAAAVTASGAPVEVVSTNGGPNRVVSPTGNTVEVASTTEAPTTVTGTGGTPTTVVETTAAPTTVTDAPAAPPATVVKAV